MLRLFLCLSIVVSSLFQNLSQTIVAKEPSTITTRWGQTSFQWAWFSYIDQQYVEGKGVQNKAVAKIVWYRPPGWKGEGEVFRESSISNVRESDDYTSVIATFKTEIVPSVSTIFNSPIQVQISREVKEYKSRPFTEVTISGTSSNELLSLSPTSQVDTEERKYFLVSDLKEPKTSAVDSPTKGKYPYVVTVADAAKMQSNWALVYSPGQTNTLAATNKKFNSITSYDRGGFWQHCFMRWDYPNVKPDEIYSHKYWMTPINISEDDSVEKIKLKASALATEALAKPVKLAEKKTRGYDYYAYEVSYRFEYEVNEWNIDPFQVSPHSAKDELVNDTCLAAIYLPLNAIAMDGPEGYPAVFVSTGESAIGLPFKDSVNGPRGESDLWSGSESAGGGFYLKKFNPQGEEIKVYYIIPAPAHIESAYFEIPHISELKGASGDTKKPVLLFADEKYILYSRIALFTGIALFILTVLSALVVVFHRRRV